MEEIEDTEARVRDILQAAFPGAVLDLDRLSGAKRISGHIAWEGFEDVEPIDRQKAVWKVLRKHLGARASDVSIILTYTPREMELMSAA
jgi:hypothetical protein